MSRSKDPLNFLQASSKRIEEEKQKVKKQKDIRFPLLYEASEHIQDDYWKNVLIDLSRARYPKKMTIDQNTILAGTKRNQLVYLYSNKQPEEIAEQIVPLLRQHLNLQSNNDIKQNSEVTDDYFNDFLVKTAENCWKKIKNKKMKHALIVEFVLRKKNDWNLCWSNSRLLLKTIENALFVYHTHSSSDIEMENGCISSISDIVYKNGHVLNERYKDFEFEGETEEDENRASNVNDHWSNYVKALTDEL